MRRIGAIAILAWASALAGDSRADVVPLENPSFESPSLADGGIAPGAPPGWEAVVEGPFLSPEDFTIGVWNPPVGAHLAGGVPDGSQAARITIDADGVGQVAIAQTTADVLELGVRYDLHAEVGDVSGAFLGEYTGFPGAQVELRAGGEMVAGRFMGSSAGEGAFAPIDLTFVAGSSAPHVGQPIEVRLLHRNVGSGAIVEFDDVLLLERPVHVYEFSFADPGGTLTGIFSYDPTATTFGIPEEMTFVITSTTGDLVPFGHVNWSGGEADMSSGGGRSELTIGLFEEATGVVFSFLGPATLDAPLPLDAFDPSGSGLYGDEDAYVQGSTPGTTITLTRVPEPSLAAAAIAAWASLAACRARFYARRPNQAPV
jgi:hypothetical protein